VHGTGQTFAGLFTFVGPLRFRDAVLAAVFLPYLKQTPNDGSYWPSFARGGSGVQRHCNWDCLRCTCGAASASSQLWREAVAQPSWCIRGMHWMQQFCPCVSLMIPQSKCPCAFPSSAYFNVWKSLAVLWSVHASYYQGLELLRISMVKACIWATAMHESADAELQICTVTADTSGSSWTSACDSYVHLWSRWVLLYFESTGYCWLEGGRHFGERRIRLDIHHRLGL
jgi:hypothetical protein